METIKQQNMREIKENLDRSWGILSEGDSAKLLVALRYCRSVDDVKMDMVIDLRRII